MSMRFARALAVAGLAMAMTAVADAKVTFESLLQEMTDLTALTYFPNPSYTVKQFSSYDQRSKDPKVLTDENWFANGDRGQFLRAEDRNGAKEYVLMDADGPGAIVRFWSANPNDAGTVCVYLDNAEQPAIELALTDMLGGGGAPFVKPISIELSRGWNSYLPIPYAKHCKVTTSKPDFYYHINYRTYETGTEVESYSAKQAVRLKEAVQKVADALAAPSKAAGNPGAAETSEFKIAAGQTADIAELGSGPRAIVGIQMKLADGILDVQLRKALLEITFDNETAPAVQVPVGDFFGTAPGLNQYESLCSGALADGTLYAHWVMPFKEKASIRIRNLSEGPLEGSCAVSVAPYKWTSNSMYFHAGFRSEYPIKTHPRQDWNFLDTAGKGRFVGDMLHITNPVKDWWGEGDEKIYVDGEAFPSHFGTGSEDYFGYAWCSPELFTHAYHNQPRCDGPGNYGHTCVSRFHLFDNIPYTKSFKFDIEVWHWADCEIAMAETSYWYAFAGGTSTFRPLEAKDLYVNTPPPPPPPRKVEGALEGEDLKVVEKTAGVADRQDLGDQWSGAAQLWWRNANAGDALTLEIPVATAGKYELHAAFTKAVDYGIHTITVNGKQAVKDLDLFNNGVIAMPEQSLGVFDLKQGGNTLKIVITGANTQAEKKYMFGLDYVKLVTAK